MHQSSAGPVINKFLLTGDLSNPLSPRSKARHWQTRSNLHFRYKPMAGANFHFYRKIQLWYIQCDLRCEVRRKRVIQMKRQIKWRIRIFSGTKRKWSTIDTFPFEAMMEIRLLRYSFEHPVDRFFFIDINDGS